MTFKAGEPSANPKGRPRKDAADSKMQPPVPLRNPWLALAKERRDGWYNLLTGLGTESRDKRTTTRFCPDIIGPEEAKNIWQGDDLGAKVVEMLPNDMTREGFRLLVTGKAEGNDENYGKELSEKMADWFDEIELVPALFDALCMERALGGAALLLGAQDDANDWSKPLNEKAIRSFDWVTVLEPEELTPIEYYTDPLAKNFGKPEVYAVTPVSTGASGPTSRESEKEHREKLGHYQRVHESRLVIFPGTRVSRIPRYTTALPGWGDSVFTRIYRVLRDFNISWGAAGILVSDFAQAVFKIEDLHKIMSENNKELFSARMAAVELSRSTARAVLIDKNEEFERQQTPVTGLAELLELFARRFCAAADYPFSVFFGESPGGINASGASSDQLRLYYDRCHSQQVRKLGAPLRKIARLKMLTMGGEPEKWSIKFNSLWQETDAERVTNRKGQMEIDKGYFEIGALGEDEIREQRFGGDDYSYETHVEVASADDGDELPTGEIESLRTPGGAQDPTATPALDPKTGQPIAGPAAASGDLQKEALNGAQVTSLVEVVTAVARGELSRQSGQKILELAFQLSPADALAVLGPEGFKPTPPEPQPNPFGGGAPGGPPQPPKPGEKPEPEKPVPPKPEPKA